jgi:RNA polymerase sigma factor (sigma-70 family)
MHSGDEKAAEKGTYDNLRKDIKLRDAICDGSTDANSELSVQVNKYKFMIINMFDIGEIENAKEVKDIIQEFFVFLLQNDKHILKTYRGESRFWTWLYTVAKRFFQEKIVKQPVPPPDDPDSIPVDLRIKEKVYAILSRMGLRRKTVLIMLYLAEMTPQETAIAMNTTVDNVYNLKHLALIEARLVEDNPKHIPPPYVNTDPNSLRLMALVNYLDGKTTPEENIVLETDLPFLLEDDWCKLKAKWGKFTLEDLEECVRSVTQRDPETSNVYEIFGQLPLDCTTVLTLLYIVCTSEKDAEFIANIDEDNGFGMRAVMFASMFGNYDMGNTVENFKDVKEKALKAFFLVAIYNAAALIKRYAINRTIKTKTTSKTSKNGKNRKQ